MKNKLLCLVSLFAGLFLATPSFGQSIHFKNGDWTPVRDADSFFRNREKFEPAAFENQYYLIVQFERTPTIGQRDQLAKIGAQLVQYLGGNAYYAAFPATLTAADLSGLHAQSISLIPADSKLHPDLKQSSAEKTKVTARFLGNHSAETIANVLKEKGITPISINAYFHRFTVEMPYQELHKLASIPLVYWIEPALPAAVPLNYTEKTLHRSNVIGANFPGARDLQGNGVFLGEWDSGPVGPHEDVDARVIIHDQDAPEGNQHCTHVAGILGGSGWIDPATRGMAPEVMISSWSFDGDIPDEMLTATNSEGIVLTQNSYRFFSCNGDYDDFSGNLDQLTRDHPSLLHVFAAGNEQGFCGTNGYHSLAQGGQSAKNSLVVGALTHNDEMSDFSSWGPAMDGRIKPEVCAVGVNVYSCFPDNTYTFLDGTSMACPGTSGTAAQLYELYKQQNSGANPPASLIRNIFANTAEDLGNLGPDYATGFGRINALRAAEAIEQHHYTLDVINEGDENVSTVDVPAGTLALKVMITWSDPEAAVSAIPTLINDLDLTVIAPDGTEFQPWVLNPEAGLEGEFAIRAEDHINNIEQVTIPNPMEGTYTFKVKGFLVPEPNQDFALSYVFVNRSITVTYPYGGEHFPSPSSSGLEQIIRWDASGVTTPFNLEYSTDGGANWTAIGTQIDPTAKQYSWSIAPAGLFTKNALIRVSSDDLSDVSDAPFTMMNTPAQLRFTCEEPYFFKWNPVENAVAYEVFKINNGQLNSLGQTPDTQFPIDGANDEGNWFTVRAIGADQELSERAIAIRFTTEPANLFIFNDPFDQSICIGDPLFMYASFDEQPNVYIQWEVSSDGGANWADVPGGNTAQLFIDVVTADMDQNLFRFRIYDACGNSLTSNGALLTVQTGIQSGPFDVSSCIGEYASFYVNVCSFPLDIQWEVSTNGGGNWSIIPGEQGETLTLPNVQQAWNGRKYRVHDLANNLYSEAATLTVTGAFNYPPYDVNACIGGSPSFYVGVCGFGNVSLIWQYSEDGGANWINIPWANQYILTLTNVQPSQNLNLFRAKDMTSGEVSAYATLYIDAGTTTNWQGTPDMLTVHFNALNNGLSSYNWDFGDGTNSFYTDPDHTYAHYGVYNVCLYTVGPNSYCPGVKCKQINLVNTAVTDPVQQGDMRVYPNPSSDLFTVVLPFIPEGDVQIQLLDMLGHEQAASIAKTDINVFTVAPLNTATTGMYLLTVHNGDQHLSKKVVLIK